MNLCVLRAAAVEGQPVGALRCRRLAARGYISGWKHGPTAAGRRFPPLASMTLCALRASAVKGQSCETAETR